MSPIAASRSFIVNLRLASERENRGRHMWRRVEAERIFQAGNDVALRSHGTRDDAFLPLLHLDRAFAGNPDLLTKVLFLLSKIVMTIDTFDLYFRLMSVFAVESV